MAPSITPSPHRFLSASGKHQAISDVQRTTPGDSRKSSHQNDWTSANAQSARHTPVHGASQFAIKPRFAVPRTPAAQHSAVRSPRTNKDRVEDFGEEQVTFRGEEGYPPLPYAVKQSRGRERVAEAFDDDEENALTGSAVHGAESESLMPSTRKRKLSVTQSRSAISGTEDHDHDYEISPPRRASEMGTPLVRSGRDASTDVSPLSPNRLTGQFLVSPRLSSSISPSNAGRSVRRFDFSRLTERTTSKLQKVTGTGQFILDSTSTGDSHNEALSLENTNLTLLFSPQKHRKYQYAPGGLAATARDWVLDAAAGINSTTTIMTFQVLTIEAGERGSRMIRGVNKLQQKERYMLIGEPRGSRNIMITKGCSIAIMDPSWTIELEEVWTVAMNWKVVEDNGG